jgi:hypothetical protein
VNLSDAFATPPAVKPRTPCHLGKVLANVDAKSRDAINAALNDPNWTAAGIARTLTENGHPIKPDNVSRHRRRLTGTGAGCECPA